MVMCRRSETHEASGERPTGRPRTVGHGGPIFLPPRKPSALARLLLTADDGHALDALAAAEPAAAQRATGLRG